METRLSLQRLCQVQIQRRLILIISVVVVFIVLAQLITFPYENYTSIASPVTKHVQPPEVVENDNAHEGALIKSKAELEDKDFDFDPRSLVPKIAPNLSFVSGEKHDFRTIRESFGQKDLGALENRRTGERVKSTRLSYMISVLESFVSAHSRKSKAFSARDRELQRARVEIKNALAVGKNPEGLHASLYRNVSRFLRSYNLMEKTLRVYVYKEGTKPIFHDPKLRGIYASEGWFMKLMEKNIKFLTKDPKKAHMFYVPISSLKLRNTLLDQNLRSHKDLEQYVKNYTDLIVRKHPFWNRSNGADHFLVACHDWALKLTKNHMGNCIRSLCNSNLAGGFVIGKDTTLPATYIRSSEDPVKDLGGNPPSERPFLAFFAGGMHGDLRPRLLHHWHDKEPDMKILGPMARDAASKAKYREYMKRSRFCVCARGYEVFTPRVVEAIYYGCVPVIVSDNYVPPFFEVLEWEMFAVFVLEKDVADLRTVLRLIPEDEYLKMQANVMIVQRHFVWHKKPVKLDLFHMVLHSVWERRVFRLR